MHGMTDAGAFEELSTRHAQGDGGAARVEIPTTSEDERWAADYQDFVHTRMARVQTAAQQWLVTMTALLSVFSAVVVVGSPATIDTTPAGAARWIILGLAGVVYLLAFAAVYKGARATFGGLGLSQSTEDSARLIQSGFGARLAKWWNPEPISGDVAAYRNEYETKTNTLRTHLHRSRVLGISAAILSGVLAWTLLLLRVIYDL